MRRQPPVRAREAGDRLERRGHAERLENNEIQPITNLANVGSLSDTRINWAFTITLLIGSYSDYSNPNAKV